MRHATPPTKAWIAGASVKPKFFPLIVKVAPLADEQDEANNELRTEVRVTSRKVQVLLLEGAMRWESSFLRRSLAGDPGINLVLGYVSDPRLRASLRADPSRDSVTGVSLADGAGASSSPSHVVTFEMVSSCPQDGHDDAPRDAACRLRNCVYAYQAARAAAAPADRTTTVVVDVRVIAGRFE